MHARHPLRCIPESLLIFTNVLIPRTDAPITLGVAYGIFWFGFLTFGLFLFGLKTAVSDDFRKSDTFSRLQHVLWAINTPETFKDWDSGNGDRKDLIAKWWSKYREVTIMQFIHLTSNMILLVPLINTGNFLP